MTKVDDGRIAYRWFNLGRGGALTGYGTEANRPAWTCGVNRAVCAVDSCHEPPALGCGCGWTCSHSLAAVAAHAALTSESLRLMVELHQEGGGRRLPSLSKAGVTDYVLAEICASGNRAQASIEDERDWFYRVELAEIRRVYLPARLERSVDAIRRRYDAELVVSDLDGREWFDSFADGVAPTPEQLGCGACPRPNPGPEEYPLCGMCANRSRRGVMFGREDGTPFDLTPFGYR